MVLSTILPRDRNLRSTGRQYTNQELHHLNCTIGIINEQLQKISARVPGLYIVDHPQFLLEDDFINDDLLSADGLHLSFEGTPVVVSNIESAIMEVRREILKEAPDYIIAPKQIYSTSGEKLAYSDVVRYGEERPQPIIVPSSNQTTNNVTNSKREPYMRQRPNQKAMLNRPSRETASKKTATRKQMSAKPFTSESRKTQRVLSQLSNKFSLLEVEECVSDDLGEEAISSLPRRLLGGGSVNKSKKKQDEKRESLNDNSKPTNQITVEVITSATTDASVCENTQSSTTDDECDQFDIPSVKTELQQLENSIRDTNDEKDVIDFDTSVRDTRTENGVKEEQLNNSDLEVIQLLNGPNDKQKDNTTDKQNTVLRSVKLFEGQTFATYEKFRIMYDIWCQENNHPMKTAGSYKNDEESNDFPYMSIRFACKHTGKPRMRGEGKRPMQAHYACECPVVVRLKLDKKGNNYIITKLIDDHNHTTSNVEFKHYTTNRKLDDDQRDDVKALIDLQVETKNIKTYIREKTGKVIQTKDILNIKQNIVRQKEGGLTKGQLLAASLNELANKKQATTYIQLDEDQANVELIYIQTMEMKDHFRKYPEILFMDTTYNVNFEGYPLFTILAEDGDGRGKPVAYCYVKSETKENMQKVLEKFCEYNDVSDVRIIMVDKDLNEINAIKQFIPGATVLLCKFHVMKYFKKKVSDLDIKQDEKKSLGLLLQQMIDSNDQTITIHCTKSYSYTTLSSCSILIKIGTHVKACG